jgi:hypothetical protein
MALGFHACCGLSVLRGRQVIATLVLSGVLFSGGAEAQVVSQRGLVEMRGTAFPQEASNDSTRAVADILVRDEVFIRPSEWLRLTGGVDLRANSHDQVEDRWRFDLADRGPLRPRASLHRATATITHGAFTIDVGKQFIRWGKTDIVSPTDHLAPRDFLNVIDTEFLAVTGARAVAQAGDRDTFEVVWVPRFTPSRLPLLNQRWTAVPPGSPELQVIDGGAVFPAGPQTGVRWSRVGTRIECSLSFFDGFNNLPNLDARVRPALTPVEGPAQSPAAPQVDVTRVYPSIRAYGADVALPLRWFTVKGEASYFTSSSPATDEYVLYVVQLERQTGEWVLAGGYVGEAITDRRAPLTFAPDRGLTRSAVGRASYTIDPNRSVAFEAAIRQNLSGAYGSAEYSRAAGQHWRATISAALIRGEPGDFLGQYRRNSNFSFVLRYSF